MGVKVPQPAPKGPKLRPSPPPPPKKCKCGATLLWADRQVGDGLCTTCGHKRVSGLCSMPECKVAPMPEPEGWVPPDPCDEVIQDWKGPCKT